MASAFIVPQNLLIAKHIPKTAALLLTVLENHRNKRTGQCNPRIKILAAELGVNEKTIDRNLARLRLLGLIRSKKGQRGCAYTLAPKAEWGPVLRGQNVPAEPLECPRTQGLNVPAGALHPYMNLNINGMKERAAARIPPQRSTYSTPQRDRQPSMYERTLEAYYAEQRRRASRC